MMPDEFVEVPDFYPSAFQNVTVLQGACGEPVDVFGLFYGRPNFLNDLLHELGPVFFVNPSSSGTPAGKNARHHILKGRATHSDAALVVGLERRVSTALERGPTRWNPNHEVFGFWDANMEPLVRFVEASRPERMGRVLDYQDSMGSRKSLAATKLSFLVESEANLGRPEAIRLRTDFREAMDSSSAQTICDWSAMECTGAFFFRDDTGQHRADFGALDEHPMRARSNRFVRYLLPARQL